MYEKELLYYIPKVILMSEKRFELEISSFSGKHMKFLNILDNGKRLNSEEIVDLLNEQQATIRRLQDLCGESDGENAKLRIENKEQQATIEELERKVKKYAKIGEEQLKQIIELQDICRQSDGKMKQPITINLTEEDEKELRKLLGLIDDE